MPNPVQSQIIPSEGVGNVVMNFQLDQLSIKEKSDEKYGKALAEYLNSTVIGGLSSYFWIRNGRWKINRNYSNGRIPMTKWQDLFEFNGKQNYLNLLWMPINITNRIICGLVGRWMARNEKIQVTATDTLSVKQKQDQYDQLEFIIEKRRQLEELQAKSGVQMIPDTGVPADKEELRLWQAQVQRLPEEILYEMGCNDVLSANGWFDVNKEKCLHDSAEVGFVGTYTWMDDDGVIHVDWVKPENAFYSYSAYPDFRDTTWRGRITTYKISELRRKYGVEFGGKLTEEELWKMATTAKEYQLYDNITWLTQWNVSFLRPYDEWNVDVIEWEFKTVDTEAYTITTTKKNKSNLIRKGRPEKKEENQEVVEDTKWNIYRGVYARATQTLLEWGLKKNMIRPQDPKEIGNAEFSYSFYMVQSYDMTSLAIPEKIQEPVDQMIAVCLRMQQLIAKMRPPGAMINWDALQNIDYGLGDANKTIDVQKLYDQTGTLYYRGTDAEGKQIPVPIIEIANAGFAPQMQSLIELYRFHYQVLKDELGEDPNLVQQAAQPRVAVANIETSQQQAQYATDYIYNAYIEVMKDTSRKISCLLKNSVTYGASAYRTIVNEDKIRGRIFSTKIQLLPTEFEMQKFEATMQKALDINQDLIMFVNPFELSRIAKEDVKLAESLFRQGQKKMLIHREAEIRQNQDATFQAQNESNKTAEEGKRATEKVKGDIDIEKTRLQNEGANKNAVLTMVTSLLSKGEPIPPQYMPLINATIENIMIPMVTENEEQKAAIREQMQQAMLRQQQMQMQPQPMEQPMQNQQPIPEQQPPMAA